MDSFRDNIVRNISLQSEAETAVKFLRLGLAEIQKITDVNAFYDPILLYLSGGLERLLKIMLCLDFQERNGRMPNPNEIWNNKNGHDITTLMGKVMKFCVPLSLPFLRDDYDIIIRNEFADKVCEILTNYAKRGRYFNIDAVQGIDHDYNSRNEWEKLETLKSKSYYGEDYYKVITQPHNLSEVYKNSTKLIVIEMELFIRALTRQFEYGSFSKKAKVFYFCGLKDFIEIRDEHLGQTDYTQFRNHEFIKR